MHYLTLLHRKFLRRLEIENDPIINTDLNNIEVMMDDTDILRHEETATKRSGRKVADFDS